MKFFTVVGLFGKHLLGGYFVPGIGPGDGDVKINETQLKVQKENRFDL